MRSQPSRRKRFGLSRPTIPAGSTTTAAQIRLIFIQGELSELVQREHAVIDLRGDEMGREIYAATGPVVVENAQTDPRVNKEIVAALGNRTIINVPVMLIDRRLGALGTGTFGEEGVKAPTADDLWVLQQIATQVGIALGRIEFEEQQERALQEKQRLQAQFLQAQKLESMGLLASGVAHDFNNLLVGVLGYASLARDEAPEGSVLEEYLDAIDLAATRASELANQLLTYSGKATFQSQPVDLGALVSEMVTLMRATIPRTVRVELVVPDEPAVLDGDATQLRQLVLNLVTNGAQAIAEGEEGVLTLEVCRCSTNDGEGILLTARDDGCGMSEETRSRLFDPFFTTKTRGRGLGMAAVLGIVRGHGAEIEVDSTLGEGASFRILFPASVATVLAAATSPRALAKTIRHAGRILVIDEDEAVGTLVHRFLAETELEVVDVSDAEEALHRFKDTEQPWSAVIIDLSLSKIAGAEMFEAVRTQAPSVPIIVTSAGSVDEAAALLREDDHAGFLAKPFRARDLVQALTEVLEAPAA